MRTSYTVLLAVLALTVAYSAPSRARSEVCDQPNGELEAAICADSGTQRSYADIKLAAAAAMGRLSPEGRKILEASQARWESRFSAACIDHLDAVARRNAWLDQPLQHCLEDFITKRKSWLDEQGKKAGDFVWQPLDDDRDLYCGQGESANLLSISRRTVRIDAPKSAAIDHWNKEKADGTTGIVDTPNDACEGDGSSEESLTVDFVAGDLVQIKSSYYQYFSDMPHGQWSEGFRLQLIEGAREVETLDIFDSGTDWRSYVAKRLYESYLAAVKLNHVPAQQTLDDFKRIAGETGWWSVNSKAMAYAFGPYDLDGYANANFDVTFTWKELRPYLRQDLPFKPDFN